MTSHKGQRRQSKSLLCHTSGKHLRRGRRGRNWLLSVTGFVLARYVLRGDIFSDFRISPDIHGSYDQQLISALLKRNAKGALKVDHRGLQNTAWTRVTVDVKVAVDPLQRISETHQYEIELERR